MVDRAPADRAQAARRRRRHAPPTGSRATRRCRTGKIIASSSQFTAGWIALRFLNDPATALGAFRPHRARASTNPITLARAGYWQGRAAEALGRKDEARAHYEAAARYPDRLLRPDRPRAARPRGPRAARRRPTRRFDRRSKSCAPSNCSTPSSERDLVAGALADLGDRSSDVGRAGRARRNRRPRTMTPAPCCCSARPRSGAACRSSTTPSRPSACRTTRAIGPAVEPALVYAIARQESTFNQRDRLERAGDGPDAGDAGGGQIHRQEVQRRPSTRSGCCPTRSTTCSSAPPSSAT